jgi:hypothetical protein
VTAKLGLRPEQEAGLLEARLHLLQSLQDVTLEWKQVLPMLALELLKVGGGGVWGGGAGAGVEAGAGAGGAEDGWFGPERSGREGEAEAAGWRGVT